jgi:hypothetical protein
MLPLTMREFIELQGASGAQYRFRPWTAGAQHPGAGGNYVFVREEAQGFTVLGVGATNDLATLAVEWAAARRRGATHLFTRLNVSHATRQAEHQDLEARLGGGPPSAPAN